jgi:hypothetical protein
VFDKRTCNVVACRSCSCFKACSPYMDMATKLFYMDLIKYDNITQVPYPVMCQVKKSAIDYLRASDTKAPYRTIQVMVARAWLWFYHDNMPEESNA